MPLYLIPYCEQVYKCNVACEQYSLCITVNINHLFLCLVAPYNVMITDSDGVTISRNTISVDNGNPFVLNCTASGGPNMFNWFKDDMLFNASSVVSISSVEATDGGFYECRISNDAGNSSVNVTVYGECTIYHLNKV